MVDKSCCIFTTGMFRQESQKIKKRKRARAEESGDEKKTSKTYLSFIEDFRHINSSMVFKNSGLFIIYI